MRNLLAETADLHAAMERLNAGIQGIVLLIDLDGRLTGVMTDGDVRRAILNGATLTDPAMKHMKRDFVSGRASLSREENLTLLSERCRQVPILDGEGRPLEMLSWTQLWQTALANPSLSGNEIKYVLDCMTSGWISSAGAYVGRFETALAELHGVKGAIACSSGTAALHLALLAGGIGAGDEVVVPSFTFGATANAVVQVGATPVFVDVDPGTWTMTPEALAAASTPKTKAVIPVHIYGHPADMPGIMKVASERDLLVIEDCAEAMTARIAGRLVGTFGDLSCFSFFSNKIMTTGEGGALIAKDERLLDRVALFRDHGMRKSRRYYHEVSGLNYRMTNLQAAIGLAQVERLDQFRAHRERLRECYEAQLGGVPGITLMPRASWAEPVNWLYTVLLPDASLRQAIADYLLADGIETRRTFTPLHDQPAFEGARIEGGMAVSQDLFERGLSLPTGNTTSEEDVLRVARILREALLQCRATVSA